MTAARTLHPVWSQLAYNGIHTLEGSEAQLIVSVRSTQLTALDPVTGRERWRRRHAQVRWNELCLTPGRVSFLSGTERLVTLDADSGDVQWTGRLPHPPRRTALYAPLKALMTVLDDHVTCRSLADGEVVAELALPGLLGTPMPDWQFEGTFGTPGRALLERGEGDRLLVLSGLDLRLEERHLGREPVTLRLDDQGGEVFFEDTAGQLCVYDLARDVTAVLGPVEHARRDRIPAVRLPDGTVLAGTSAGLLVRFAPDGGVLERVQAGKRVLTPPRAT